MITEEQIKKNRIEALRKAYATLGIKYSKSTIDKLIEKRLRGTKSSRYKTTSTKPTDLKCCGRKFPSIQAYNGHQASHRTK